MTILSDLEKEGRGYRDKSRCQKKGRKYVGKFKNLPNGSWVQYFFTFYHKKDAEQMKKWLIGNLANHVRIYPVGPVGKRRFEVWENS